VDMSSNRTSLPVLPILQDPKSTGVFFVHHMPAIIALVFVSLLLSMIATASFIQLDVTIKADSGAIVKCEEESSRYCVRIHVSGEEAKQIALDNRVLLVVETEGNYRRKTLEARVDGIEESELNDEGMLSRSVTIKLAEGSPPSDVLPKFALVVVGSQSGWKLLMSSMQRII
jgi:hypothetical protein